MPQETQNKQNQAKKQPKESKNTTKSIGFFALWRYCPGHLKPLTILAALLSIAHGIIMPLFAVIFGNLTEGFTPDKSNEEIKTQGLDNSLIMIYFGGLAFVAAGGGAALWRYIADKMEESIKKEYFKKVLEQEIGWFDVENPEKLTSKYSEEMAVFRKGTGESVHVFLFALSSIISGMLIGLFIGWKYTLFLLLTLPFMIAGMVVFIVFSMKEQSVAKESYIQAGGLSEQSLSQIKTVQSLNGQAHELKIYLKELMSAIKVSRKYQIISSITMGIFYFAIISEYGLGFWIGGYLVKNDINNSNADESYNAFSILQIFFAVITGAFAIGQFGPSSEALSKARESGYHLYKLIERKPSIIIDDPKAKKIGTDHTLKGDISFNDVTFKYPSRPDITILNNLTFKIKAGQKVAFVGETGCGKSTTIQLIERYYDANHGTVNIDGINIKDFNLKSLRNKIGYVGQEPKLFAMSIRDNLKIAKPDATDAEIHEALKMANAYDFVMELDDKLDTYVGTGGSQLSGGQKQRIGIARSALQNPSILLLDESTSALDRENERLIQATLDRFSSNRTTITIAHRLSTIINSDVIFVLNKGHLAEQGTHQELLNRGGVYSNLVQHQLKNIGNSGENTPEDNVTVVNDTHSIMSKTKYIENKVIDDDQEPDVGNKKKVSKKAQKKRGIWGQLFSYVKGSWIGFIIAIIFSLINGFLFPLFGLFLADMVDILSKFELLKDATIAINETESDLSGDVDRISLYFLVLAFAALIFQSFQNILFKGLGNKITFGLRRDLFKTLLNKDMAFFDKEKNNSGYLSTKLGKDTVLINSIISASFPAIIQGIGSMVGGLILAFFSSWRLAIIGIFGVPMIMLTGIIESKMMVEAGASEGDKDEDKLAEDVKIFQESATNMRTVSSINCQHLQAERYAKIIAKDASTAGKQSTKIGFIYGFGQAAIFIVNAALFFGGAYFTADYGLSFQDLFRAIFLVMFAAYGAGMSQQFMPDLGKAFTSADEVFRIMNRPNEIEFKSSGSTNPIKGEIEFRNVKFRYPGRQNAIFNNLSFVIKPN